jgi:hypothetical protein
MCVQDLRFSRGVSYDSDLFGHVAALLFASILSDHGAFFFKG